MSFEKLAKLGLINLKTRSLKSKAAKKYPKEYKRASERYPSPDYNY